MVALVVIYCHEQERSIAICSSTVGLQSALQSAASQKDKHRRYMCHLHAGSKKKQYKCIYKSDSWT